MEIEIVKISTLSVNTGQIEGVPANPRIIRDQSFTKLVNSIQEDPEFMQLKPIYVYDNIVIGGNMRLRACKELKWKEIPVIRIPQETSIEKLKAFIVKDNSHYGENDWEAFANEWSDCPLHDWGVDMPDYGEEKEPQAKGKKPHNVTCPNCSHEFEIEL